MNKPTALRTGPAGPVRFLSAALLILLLQLPGCSGGRSDPDPRLHISKGRVSIDLGEFGERRGSFYHYISSSGKRVDFFVCLESSGRYRVWLDACRECYRWRKGYNIDGDVVVCRRCDERFEIDRMEEGRGSCVPVALPSSVSDGRLVIPVEALEEGVRYF